MYKIRSISFLFLICLLFSFSSADAQSDQKIKITIKKSENGKTETIKREFDGDNEELQKFLEEMGIDLEIDNSDNEVVEVIIDKRDFDGDAEVFENSFLRSYGFSDEPRAFLGIMMEEHEDDKVLITEVIEDSPAKGVGLLEDDILISIDGEEMNSTTEVVKKVTSYEPGTKVKVAVERDGKKKTFNVELGEKENDFFGIIEAPNGEDFFRWNGSGSCSKKKSDCSKNVWIWDDEEGSERAFLGVIGGASGDMEGALIQTVTAESSAEEMGIQSGDVITSFNGKSVEDFDELAEAISETKAGDNVSIVLERDGETINLEGAIGKKENVYFNWEDDNITGFNFDCKKFNSEELEEQLEKMQEELREQLDQIENMEELQNFDFDFDFEFDEYTGNSESITVIVLMEEFTQDEVDQVNENAEHKISIDNSLNLDEINFFPNPNQGLFNLNFMTKDQGDLTVNIYDQSGKTVYKEMLSEFEGEYNNQIDISNRSNGTYYLQIIQDGKTFNTKLIKQ